MKLLLTFVLANLLASFLQGFLSAAWKELTTGTFPRLQWSDSKVQWRTSQSATGARYRTVLNLQTPARRRELRQRHEQWVARMQRDHGMDFIHTL